MNGQHQNHVTQILNVKMTNVIEFILFLIFFNKDHRSIEKGLPAALNPVMIKYDFVRLNLGLL